MTMPGAMSHYGIREFGMAAAMNGMALHGGVVPYGGTFLVFSDYCRNAIRMSAIQHAQVIYVLTHDSIGLGEDGPTHQPVEHVMSLRLIPNLNVFRPADVIETAECWALALQAEGTPSVLALSRQNLPQLRTSAGMQSAKGGYRLKAAEAARKVVLVATGSEVEIAMACAPQLEAPGSALMSFRCRAQNCSYSRTPPIGPICSRRTHSRSRSRPGSLLGWERYVTGQDGLTIGIDRFGASAPADQLYSYFGLTAEAIVPQITARLGQ
jgi:transketolase